MKSRAAVLWGMHQDFEVVELELDEPREHEVLIRYLAAGFCHSDDLLRDGSIVPRYPLVGGHEGAGVIEAVGPGVTRVKPGDHVVCSFIPACGHCRFCASGQQNLCDDGATILDGQMPDGTFRFHHGSQDVGAYCMLGTFAQYSVISETSCIVVDKELPLESVVLISCGVPTGWGSSVYVADVQPGETVVIYGIGGLGSAAVQGALQAGAAHVVAVDPLENKRAMAKSLGATHTVATAEEAHALVLDITNGVGADKSLVIVDYVTSEVVAAAVYAVRKGGTTVITGLSGPDTMSITFPSQHLSMFQKTIKGTLYGGCNPNYDIPRLVQMYKNKQLELDSLVTRTYTLDEVNQGYTDLREGKNIRGVMVFD